jgi:hypothetical protein
MAQIIRQPNETDEAWAARVKQLRETPKEFMREIQKAFVLPPPSMSEESKQQDRRWLPIINDGVHTNIHGTEVHIPETNPFAEASNLQDVEKDDAILMPEKGGLSENEQPKQYPVVKIESSKGGARSAAEMDAELIRMRATLSTMQNSSQGSEQTPTGKISGTVDGGGGNYSDWAFGFSISGANVTVNGGFVLQGARIPAQVLGKDIPIDTDLTYIFVRFSFGASEGHIMSSLTRPSATETTIDFPLHYWRLNSGVVSLGSILHLGDIVLPSNFA